MIIWTCNTYNAYSVYGHFLHIFFAYITYSHIFSFFLLFSAWVDRCQSAIIFNRLERVQALYVISVSTIFRLLLVPVETTGTIPFDMRGEFADFSDASCDKTKNGDDGCRWWCVNSWAIGLGTKQKMQ